MALEPSCWSGLDASGPGPRDTSLPLMAWPAKAIHTVIKTSLMHNAILCNTAQGLSDKEHRVAQGSG